MQKDSIILYIKGIIKKSPRLKHWLGLFVDHFYEDFSVYKIFIKKNKDKRFKVNIGSGVAPDICFVNVDMALLSGVHLCADALRLPFKENSIDALLCEQLIEHIQDPQRMVDEFYRVLKPGGEIYITAPFMYPFHEAPIDLNRWTLDGFKNTMSDFSTRKAGVLGGPTATLVEAFHGWLAILLSFNSDKAYQILYLLFLPFLKPFKLLDLVLLNKFESSHRLAAMLYYHGEKLLPGHAMKSG